MASYITLPGIGGSGSTHWQTVWESAETGFSRFKPADWDSPNLEDWIQALDREIAASATAPILVAHSLACLLVAHWQARSSKPIAGAFLVAVPDPTSTAFPGAASGFANPPLSRFRFPSQIVASTDDPYGSPDYVRDRAEHWGSSIVELGALGHINGASGLGSWPQGRRLLSDFESNISGSPISTTG